MDQTKWVAAFVEQLFIERPHTSLEVAEAIAFQQWTRHCGDAPGTAAIRWAEEVSAIQWTVETSSELVDEPPAAAA
jgi:hypothetical protein